MPFFARPLLLAGVSLLALASAPAYAQTTGDETANAAAETIIVTGTRRNGRTVADSPVPIDVIAAAQLAQSGFTETNRLLNEQLPSFNFPPPSASISFLRSR